MSNNSLAYSPTLALVESHVAIYKIYILKNPINDEIFYVGQTKMPLETRLSGHISETGANREKINYIKAILDAGFKPIIEAIETIATTCYIDTLSVNEREIYWIRYHLSLKCNLLNKASTSPDTKCREYHGYLSAIKRGETSKHYYYCGKTAGGYEVYDEAKLKMDGFVLKKPVPDKPPVCGHYYNPFKSERYILKTGLPLISEKAEDKSIKTVSFPEQPAWTTEFSSSIPPYKSLLVEMYFEHRIDDCDLEDDELENDTCDYELNGDEEDFDEEWITSPTTLCEDEIVTEEDALCLGLA